MNTVEEKVVTGEEPPTQIPTEAGPSKRIMVVDDIDDNRALLVTHLHIQGYEVEALDSGYKALASIEANPPALILLDIMMPGLDGYEVAERIKANPDLPFIPIIFVTAKNEVSDKIYGLELGADDFLSKPVNAAELLARVRSLLRLKSAQDSLTQKHAELSTLNDQLKQSEELREELVHMITHDLRGPLTGLVGALELLEDGTLGPLGTQQLQFTRMALKNTSLLGNMIDDMLEVYRIESDRSEIDREPLNIRELMQQVIEQFQSSTATVDRRLTLLNTADDNLPPVAGDHRKLLRVLSNLMSNAIKYTEQGGVTMSAAPWDGRLGPRAVGNCPPAGNSMLVSVVDTGPGIPEEAREQVFEKFFRVRGKLNGHGHRQVAGTGLGLNFVKQVVEAHGGCVWVESGPNGTGSAFRFTVPLA